MKGASKNGYTFGGWYGSSNCTDTSVTTLNATWYKSNITLYAKWTSVSSPFTVVNGALTGYNGSDTNVIIPDGVTSISASVFANKTNITSVTIPSSVTSIGASAFSGCRLLSVVNIGRASNLGVTTLGSYVFQSCSSNLVLYMPNNASVAAYKTATNWNSYSSKIMRKGLPANYNGYFIYEMTSSGLFFEISSWDNDPTEFLVVSDITRSFDVWYYTDSSGQVLLFITDTNTSITIEADYLCHNWTFHAGVYYLFDIADASYAYIYFEIC